MEEHLGEVVLRMDPRMTSRLGVLSKWMNGGDILWNTERFYGCGAKLETLLVSEI